LDAAEARGPGGLVAEANKRRLSGEPVENLTLRLLSAAGQVERSGELHALKGLTIQLCDSCGGGLGVRRFALRRIA